jgi:hypothetical protein
MKVIIDADTDFIYLTAVTVTVVVGLLYCRIQDEISAIENREKNRVDYIQLDIDLQINWGEKPYREVNNIEAYRRKRDILEGIYE